jgi:hypothetical protein
MAMALKICSFNKKEDVVTRIIAILRNELLI